MAKDLLNSELYDLCCNAFRREDEQSFNMIRHWFETNRDDHDRVKSAQSYTGHYHTTPLHRILGSQTPLDIVEMFIEHVPESVRNVDDGGRLPLHIACYRGAPLEVLNALIQVYPESYNVLSILNKKPSDFLKEWAQNTHGNEHITMLHNAAARGYSVNLLRLLVGALPNCSKVQDKNGMLPLHHACGLNNANDIMSTIKFLLDANPEGARVIDNAGRTPSQLLEPEAARRDETGMLLLHHQAASSTSFDDDLLSFLFGAYPEGIATPDKCGMLPFHHACLNNASSLDTVILFLKLYPESLFFSF